MAKLSKFVKDVNNIQALSDRPNTADGLTSQKLKERFDKAGTDIKSYLNDTLTSEIESLFVGTDDSRLTDSRKCNNEFDAFFTARDNLKIKAGTSLPEIVEEDCIFLVYEEDKKE